MFGTPPRPRRRASLLAASLLALAVVSAACTTSDRPPNPAPTVSGWLHTDGRRILDAAGTPVRMVGVGIHGMEPGTGQPSSAGTGQCRGWIEPTPATYTNVRAWGFNTVRLAWSWANLEPDPPTTGADGVLKHSYNQAYLAALQHIVASFGAQHVAVVLDMHQNKWTPAFLRSRSGKGAECPGSGLPTWLYLRSGIHNATAAKSAFFADQDDVQQQLADAWKAVASRFADDRTVIGADMFNEPYPTRTGDPAALNLDRLYQTLGSAIRSVDPRVLLIFEDTPDRGTGQFGVTKPPPFDDVVYSYHLYVPGWDPLGEQAANDYLKRAQAWNVPTWIGEFNAFGGANNVHGGRSNWQASTTSLMAFCTRNDIGWSLWAYAGANSLVQPGGDEPKSELLSLVQQGL